MTGDEGASARQASVDGVGGRTVNRLVAILCWLSVPLVPVALFLDGEDWAWWEVPATIGSLLILGPIGFVMWSGANRARADIARLRQSGRPAVAEVVGLELDEDPEGPTMAVLSLRISGDDVPPFSATYRCRPEPGFKVGARIKAVVDPFDNLFTLKRI
ncbi:hypothetical protein ACQPZF_32610 [Actinosynnema sp. CS-041913]|uniref:hypothetical protein n=1 Tax=Actinosynnema sp. CS-041913 TaxID=3239917 RepID=UPI003D8FB74C